MSLRLVICMGVAGCGKSTVAQAIANRTGMIFIDADDFHSDANKALMGAGKPLCDADREPWMDAICGQLSSLNESGSEVVLAHSALRRAHRERLRNVGYTTLFLHLIGNRKLLENRVDGRDGHFISSDLVASQFESLQATDDEADIIVIDATADLAEVTDSATRLVAGLHVAEIHDA